MDECPASRLAAMNQLLSIWGGPITPGAWQPGQVRGNSSIAWWKEHFGQKKWGTRMFPGELQQIGRSPVLASQFSKDLCQLGGWTTIFPCCSNCRIFSLILLVRINHCQLDPVVCWPYTVSSRYNVMNVFFVTLTVLLSSCCKRWRCFIGMPWEVLKIVRISVTVLIRMGSLPEVWISAKWGMNREK